MELTRTTFDMIKGSLSSLRVTIASSLIGAVIRSLNDKLLDTVTVIDFGADPRGIADSTAAFQAAWDCCTDKAKVLGHGLRLRIPGGNYKITGKLNFNWRATDDTANDADTRRISIIGDGYGCTFINDMREDPQGEPLMYFDGGLTDPHLRISLYGFRIQRKGQDFKGWGFYFRNIAIMDMVNTDTHWFDHGAVFHDVIQCKIDHCQFGANKRGMVASKLNWTQPNVFDLRHVMFGGNKNSALTITNGANFKIDTCTFEGTGSSFTDDITVSYTGAPYEGGLGMMIVNSYFENNHVLSDVNVGSNEAASGNFIIEGNSFQRTSPERYCRQHLNLSPNNSAGKHRYHLRGNKFKFAGGYTHQVGDGSVVVQTPWAEVKEEGNLYEPQQPPTYGNNAIDGYNNKIVALAKISAGATPGVVNQYNVASVVRNATGVYTLNFIKPLTFPPYSIVATVEGALGTASVTGYSVNSLQITINDNTWSASNNIAFNVQATGVML